MLDLNQSIALSITEESQLNSDLTEDCDIFGLPSVLIDNLQKESKPLRVHRRICGKTSLHHGLFAASRECRLSCTSPPPNRQLQQDIKLARYVRDSGRRYLAELCYIIALEQYSMRYHVCFDDLVWNLEPEKYMRELVLYLGASTGRDMPHSRHVFQRTLGFQLKIWDSSIPPWVVHLNTLTLRNLGMYGGRILPIVKPQMFKILATASKSSSIIERLWDDRATFLPICFSRPPKERQLSATFRIFHATDTFIFTQYCVEMLVGRCVALQQRLKWSELLSASHFAYQLLALSLRCLPEHYYSRQIFIVRSALMSVPRPLGQHIALEEVEKILHLDCKMFRHVTSVPRTLGWIEEEELSSESEIDEDQIGSCLVNCEDIVMEDVHSAEEVESSIGDMSSNRLGMTFTESASGITDLGLDYSDLW